MSILIDGYNLLHAVGIIPAGSQQASLEKARRELFTFLARNLTANERQRTTIVFDARRARRGLPHKISYCGIQVLFAHDHDEADDLIEELIRADHLPQKLTVVSSDHRIQRAANRRRALSVDSDQWYWQIRERPHREQLGEYVKEQEKPGAPVDEELAEWLAIFGDVCEIELEASRLRSSDVTNKDEAEDVEDDIEKPSDVENPFPPGYGEDLLDDRARRQP